MKITKATAKGTRSYQEDTSVIAELPQGTLLGVFDGHGGDEASQFMMHYFVKMFKEALSRDEYCVSALRAAFKESALRLRDYGSGTTASVIFTSTGSGRMVCTAVIGDSPIIAKVENTQDWRTFNSAIWFGPDHNVRTNEAERKAAEARGGRYNDGYICKGYNGLQMGRALGDATLSSILSTEPEINVITVAHEGFILIGSDGLFDPAHYDFKEAAEQVLALIDKGSDAQALVDRAVMAVTGDNATAILVRF